MLKKSRGSTKPFVQKTPVVLLNSGGFDSVTLSHYLYDTLKGKEIHHLHFLYGARNEEQQLACAKKDCDLTGGVWKEIRLPAFDWSASEFFKGTNDLEGLYVEYRNLVFLSYAVSYAQSVGAKEIYVAFLKDGTYLDATPSFLKGLNDAISKSDISIKAPFIRKDKEDVIYTAWHDNSFGTFPGLFFSCDNPDSDGNPCGKCSTCQVLQPYLDSLKESGVDFVSNPLA